MVVFNPGHARRECQFSVPVSSSAVRDTRILNVLRFDAVPKDVDLDG